jgi:hypothetical protein
LLPDYPKIKRYLQKRFNDTIQEEIRKNPLLSLIKYRESHEGNSFEVTTLDGYVDKGSFKSISTEFNIPYEEMIEKGPDAYFSKVGKIVEDMVKESSKDLIQKMEQVTKRTGNIVGANSKPFSPELLLNAMEKLEIDFDEFGKPMFPTLIMSPELFEKIQKEIPKWESDPKYDKMMKDLTEKKRKEWIDRKNSRKLVD